MADAVIASIGQRTTVADIRWLGLISYLGTPHNIQEQWPHLFDRAAAIHRIDPRFTPAYEAPGLLLMSVGRVDAADEMFAKGLAINPTRWRLAFYAGFNAWFGLGDAKHSAELLLRASESDESPAMLPGLASRILATGHDPATALGFMAALTNEDTPPGLRDTLKRLKDDLTIEFQLRAVEERIQIFRINHARPPRGLSEIGIEDPSLRFDPLTGEVSSSLLERRVMLPQDHPSGAGISLP